MRILARLPPTMGGCGQWRSGARWALVAAVPCWMVLAAGWVTAASASTGASGASDSPEWEALWAFPVALLVSCVLAGALFARSFPQKGLGAPLEHLEKSWSFSESWVSNVTVTGGLLSGIFGSSEVITALLGTETKSAVALATVGGAAAIFFTASSPVIVAATRSKQGNFITAAGLLAGAAVTIAGASAELWVLYRSGAKLSLGGWQHGIIAMAILAELLLAVYAVRSLRGTLRLGLEGEAVPQVTDALTAISGAMRAHTSVDAASLGTAMKALAKEHPELASRPLAPSRRIRRSAVL